MTYSLSVATADDCSAYLVDQLKPLPPMKLHRLCYYAQAFHLVWQGEALFADEIAALPAGPALPGLYKRHRYSFELLTVWSWGSSDNLTNPELSTLDKIIVSYGREEAGRLAQLAQSEEPWCRARQGLIPCEQGQRLISQQSLLDYYSNVANNSQAIIVAGQQANTV